MCACVNIYMSQHILRILHVYIYTRTHTYMHIPHVYMNVCVYVCMNVCVYVYMNVCVYVYINVCVYVYMNVYTRQLA